MTERWKNVGVTLLVIGAFALLAGTVQQSRPEELPTAGLLAGSDVQPAKDVTLSDATTGKPVSLLAEAKTQPVVINFWATWCGPCQQELPHLQRISEVYRGRVKFFGISSSDSPENIRVFAKQNGLTFSMLSDAKHDASTLYGVDSIPRLLVVDTHGDVRVVTKGFDPDIDVHLPAALDALLSEAH